MISHVEARACGATAVKALFGREPVGGEPAGLAGVAFLETGYGSGWKGSGVGSENQGAIQCGSGWTGDRFSYVDTHPNADGTNTRYQVDFRKYKCRADGWLDLGRVAYVNRGRASVRAAAVDRDWYAMSSSLHQTGYYEGFGRTVADRIQNHYRALSRGIALADGAARLPSIPVHEIPPTLRRGARGEPVRLLQMELRLAADGLFGPHTDAVLRAYQALHGLAIDGVCGPKTWETLFGDDYVPRAA